MALHFTPARQAREYLAVYESLLLPTALSAV